MLASAADARLLGAWVQSSVPELCKQGQQNAAANGVTLTTLFTASLIGHCVYSWGSMHGGLYQLLAVWICVELAYYAWHRGRCAVFTS